MAQEAERSFNDTISDFIDRNKKEVEKVFKAIEPIFTGSEEEQETQNNGNEANTAENTAQPADEKIDASQFAWDPGHVYFIDANGTKIITGAVIFDDKLGFTKSYSYQSGEITTMQSVLLADITAVRPATASEREFLEPEPTLDEAIAAVRARMNTPKEQKALQIILRELHQEPTDTNTKGDQ